MEKLKSVRISKNYTYQRVADLLKISKTYYWQIENDRRRLSYDLAIMIADVFETTPDELLYIDSKRKLLQNKEV